MFRIFCYGSLMNPVVRSTIFNRHIQSFPYTLPNMKRVWNARIYHKKMTALGIELDDNSSITGSIFYINKREIDLLDTYEKSYARMYSATPHNLYIYIPHSPLPPTEHYPVKQEYIDLCLSQCNDPMVRDDKVFTVS